jgi:hypothetical protein
MMAGWHIGTFVGTKIADEVLGASCRVGFLQLSGPSRKGAGANNGAVLPMMTSSAPMGATWRASPSKNSRPADLACATYRASAQGVTEQASRPPEGSTWPIQMTLHRGVTERLSWPASYCNYTRALDGMNREDLTYREPTPGRLTSFAPRQR